MSRDKFRGIRRRVEGERAAYAVAAVERKGFTIKHHARLGNDTGYIIRTKEGPVISLFDTGTITVGGNNCALFGERDSLRMPATVKEALAMSRQEGGAAQQLFLDVNSSPGNAGF